MRAQLVFAAVALNTALWLTPGCGWTFRCGCRSLWSGAAALCNVHASGAAHCPWCEWPLLGAVAAVMIVGLQWLVFRTARRRTGLVVAALVSLAALPPAAAAAGAATWLATDYPHLFADGARAALGLPAGPLRCGGP